MKEEGKGAQTKKNVRLDNMTTWTSDELNKIDVTEGSQIPSLRQDGTLRKPVIIWTVRVGDDIYVRPVYGCTSAWFRGVQIRQIGHIKAGGVYSEEPDSIINDQLDTAYAAKYSRYASIIPSINNPTARAATIKLVPRDNQ